MSDVDDIEGNERTTYDCFSLEEVHLTLAVWGCMLDSSNERVVSDFIFAANSVQKMVVAESFERSKNTDFDTFSVSMSNFCQNVNRRVFPVKREFVALYLEGLFNELFLATEGRAELGNACNVLSLGFISYFLQDDVILDDVDDDLYLIKSGIRLLEMEAVRLVAHAETVQNASEKSNLNAQAEEVRSVAHQLGEATKAYCALPKEQRKDGYHSYQLAMSERLVAPRLKGNVMMKRLARNILWGVIGLGVGYGLYLYLTRSRRQTLFLDYEAEEDKAVSSKILDGLESLVGKMPRPSIVSS